MKKLIITISFFCILFLSYGISYSQTSELNKIDSEYDSCLAKGENMYVCSQIHYAKIDSMLTAVYKLLYSKLDEEGKEKLKQNQLKWSKKKDKDFRKIEANIDPTGGYDDKMIALEEKTEILHKRVEYLIIWIEKLK